MPLIKWITVRLDVSETNGAVANKGMEPQGRRRISPFRVTKRSTKLRRLSKTTRLRVHVQTVGLNAETKKVSAPSRRRRMSLDIPFYRTFPITALIRHFPDARSMISIGMCDRMRGSIVWRGLNSWRIEKPTRPNHSAVYCNRHITTGDWRTESVQLPSPSENSP